MLLKRLRLQLTGLCALITILILSVFTILYLFVAEHTMKENLALSFRNQFDTIGSSIKQQDILTYPYLLRMEQNNDCLIFLWDNGIPLSFNGLASHAAYSGLAESAHRKYCAQAADGRLEGDVLFASRAGKAKTEPNLYLGVGNLSTDGMGASRKSAALKEQKGLVLLMISPNASLHDRLAGQRAAFALLSLAGCLLLTLFSYLFTGRMLRPIRESQEKQLSFIAGASHELRTPLAVILSSVEARPPLFEETVKTETLRMGRLVDELLLLSKLDRRALSQFPDASAEASLFCFAPLEADTFLLDFYERTEKYAQANRRNLTLSLPTDPLPKFMADKDKLHQLLEILLQNAVSYTAEGGHIQLSLTYAAAVRQICFEVSDDGIGIPDTEKENIFERFYRVEGARSAKGHFGLGLCIAREIMTAHRGSISVSDAPGSGCVFSCRFPADG